MVLIRSKASRLSRSLEPAFGDLNARAGAIDDQPCPEAGDTVTKPPHRTLELQRRRLDASHLASGEPGVEGVSLEVVDQVAAERAPEIVDACVADVAPELAPAADVAGDDRVPKRDF